MKKIFTLLALACGMTVSATSHAAEFVLVHGAWADAHAWSAVAPLLEQQGHRVSVVNLPGQGRDATPLKDISLATHVKAIEAQLDKTQGPVVLVGHSLAGMLISQVAEHYPQKITRAVYVAGFLPRNGDSALSLLQQDKQSILGRYLNVSADHASAGIRPGGRVLAVCDDCPPAIQDALAGNDRVEPMKPFADTVTLSAQRFGRVAKSYIFTTGDKALGHEAQRWMASRDGSVDRQATLETAHLPFLSQPEAFVRALIQVSDDARSGH